jgi:PAS domain S-box-containing protein
MDSIFQFFDSTNLSPHGYCLLWRPGLVRLHVISDALIGLAYFSIPVALVIFIRRRGDIVFGSLFWLFALFILACGTTHWFAIWTIWHPDYGLEGLAKAVTALVSVMAAITLWQLLPKLLAVPSLARITEINADLQAEIRERIDAQSKLTTLNLELEARVAARTAELTALNRSLQKSEERFRRVVESAPSAIVMITAAGRIEMINAQTETLFDYPRDELLGRPIEVLVPARYRQGHPDLRGAFFTEPRSRPMSLRRDLFALRRDGTEFPVEIGLNPIDTDDGTMVLSVIVDISDRKHKEQRIEAALKEKDVLLSEIHHRVKNNLQIVQSLLDLQSSRVSDAAAFEILRESRNRVNSMAIIHQVLYGARDFRRVDFASVLKTLVPHLTASYGLDDRRIRVTIEASPVYLPLNLAIPSGLIVNELISNALKHAFPEARSGRIDVALAETESGTITVSVTDTGVGIPEDRELEASPSLGLKLVHLLAAQIGGTVTVKRREPTTFKLTFPVAA